jgi:hypothetical protein
MRRKRKFDKFFRGRRGTDVTEGLVPGLRFWASRGERDFDATEGRKHRRHKATGSNQAAFLRAPFMSFVVIRAFLDFFPKVGAGILGIQLRQFPQEFLGALVAGHGDGDLDLDDLVTAGAVLVGRWHAFFP